MKQPLRYPWLDLDVDDVRAPVIAVHVDVTETKAEVPDHWHRKGQLVFALGGGVTCRVPSGLGSARILAQLISRVFVDRRCSSRLLAGRTSRCLGLGAKIKDFAPQGGCFRYNSELHRPNRVRYPVRHGTTSVCNPACTG